MSTNYNKNFTASKKGMVKKHSAGRKHNMSIVIEELTCEERVNKLSFFNTGEKNQKQKNQTKSNQKTQMVLLYVAVKK